MTEPRALELLEHRDWLRQLAARLVADPALADDLVQETWLAALRSPGERSRAWFGRVLRNRAHQHARERSGRAARERDAGRPDALDDEPLCERIELRRRLAGFVLALDPIHRRAVVLRHYEGHSVRAIARLEGVPVATVKTRLRRALELLRERLSADDRRDWRAALLALARPPAPRAQAVRSPGLAAGAAAAAVATLAWVGLSTMRTGPADLPHDAPLGALASGVAAAPPDGVVAPSAAHGRATPRRSAVEAPEQEGRDGDAIAVTRKGLAPGIDVSVDVVDRDGAPRADARVLLLSRTPVDERPEGEARVDPDTGRATLRLPTSRIDATRRYFLTLDAVGAAVPEVALDLAPGAGPVTARLTCPPLGTVRVVLDGPIDATSQAALVQLRAPGRHGRASSASEWVSDERELVFERAGSDALTATLFGGKDLVEDERAFDGPASEGAEVVVHLQAARDVRRIVGRYLGGEPEAARVLVEQGGWRNLAAGRYATQPDGRFELTMTEPLPDGTRCWIALARKRGAEESAAREVTVPAAGATLDLGDLDPRPAPLFAAGRVLDAQGADARAGLLAYALAEGAPLPDAETDDFTHLAVDFRAVEGAFELREAVPPGEYALVVRGAAGEAVVRVRAGATGLDVRLAPAPPHGALRGSLALPAGFPSERLTVALLDAEGREIAVRSGVASDGSFLLERVPLGRCTLAVTSGRHALPLLQVPAVDVAPGERSPAALQEVDARELRVIDLEVVTESGAAPRGVVSVRAARGSCGFRMPAGRLSLLAGADPVALEVVCPGYTPLRIDDARDAVRLTATPAVPLTLEFADDAPADGRLALEPEDGALTLLDEDGRRAFPAELEDRGVVVASRPGGTVRVWLGTSGPWRARWLGRADAAAQRFTVPVEGGGVRIR